MGCENNLLFQYVEKEVKVEDPALKLEVEKLSKENAELRSQVNICICIYILMYFYIQCYYTGSKVKREKKTYSYWKKALYTQHTGNT